MNYRGFKKGEKMIQWQIKIQLDDGAKAPVKAHEADAGFDLFQKEGSY